ncbi:MAG: A/G-specific adenine glycosylase [Phycisphaerae bacterium]|nr:A/G-specific adenine glycosylase [Phycisphaerae bacterium]
MVRPTKKQLLEIPRALLKWFHRRRRDMPWRSTRDPYAIWISEIMLQQTRVSAVTPYYLRFLKRFPSVESLARAKLGTVLKFWEGLGYYTRARNLHKAAKMIVREYDARLPETAAELRTLPGVGRYTAGAVASIAFGLDEPVLDGNVTRVLCRVFRISENPKDDAVRETLWRLARALLPPGDAGDFNQSMMELGATLCLPRNPRCEECPIQPSCRAHRYNEQANLPVKIDKTPLPHFTIVAGVIRKDRNILIDRRKPEGLLGGLWEFPGGKVESGETLPEALRREVREEVGVEIEVGEEIAVVHHAYSHFRITLHAMECEYLRGTARAIQCDDVKWVSPKQLSQYAFPKANHKIIQYCQK